MSSLHRSPQKPPMGPLGFQSPEALIAHLRGKYSGTPEYIAFLADATGYFPHVNTAEYVALASA